MAKNPGKKSTDDKNTEAPSGKKAAVKASETTQAKAKAALQQRRSGAAEKDATTKGADGEKEKVPELKEEATYESMRMGEADPDVNFQHLDALTSRETARLPEHEVANLSAEDEVAALIANYQSVVSLFPRITNTVYILLGTTAKRCAFTSVQREPIIQYCYRQVTLWSKFLALKVKDKQLTCHMVQDCVITLFELHRYTIEKTPSSTLVYAEEFRKLVVILAELGAILDKLSPRPLVLDYVGLGRKACDLSAERNKSYKGKPDNKSLPVTRHFSCVSLLGAGGFGAVYKSVYLPAQFPCSVKLVAFSCYPRLEHCIADRIVACMIDHPCVVKYYCMYNTTAGAITSMEYIKGQDLQKVLDAATTFPLNQCQMLFAQFVAGIMHLHQQGFIHRDIKTNNALLRVDGRLKVIDFDTSKICIGHYTARTNRTFFTSITANEFEDDECAGTLPFMSPETVEGTPYGRASDWWSMGVVIYKFITGKTPFRGNTEDQIRDAIMKEPVEFDCGKDDPRFDNVKSLCTKLLTKKSLDRLGSHGYKEIILHPFLANVDWDKLQQGNALGPIRGFEKALYTTVASELARPMESMKSAELMAISPQASPNTQARRDILRLEAFYIASLQGKTPKNGFGVYPLDSPIFCYIDPLFRKAIESLQTPEYTDSQAPMLKPISIASDCTAMGYPDISSMKPSESECLDILVDMTDATNFLSVAAMGMELNEAYHEDGSVYYMVTKISKASPAAKSRLLEGDVVVAINGNSIVNASKMALKMALLSNKSSVMVTVLSSTIIRMITSKPDMEHYMDIVSKKTVKATVTQLKRGWFSSQSYQIDTNRVKYLSRANNVFMYAHVVWTSPKESTSIYVGDIIHKIDNVEASTFDSNEAVRKQFASCKGDIVLTISPTSPLRTKRIICDRLLRHYEPGEKPAILAGPERIPPRPGPEADEFGNIRAEFKITKVAPSDADHTATAKAPSPPKQAAKAAVDTKVLAEAAILPKKTAKKAQAAPAAGKKESKATAKK